MTVSTLQRLVSTVLFKVLPVLLRPFFIDSLSALKRRSKSCWFQFSRLSLWFTHSYQSSLQILKFTNACNQVFKKLSGKLLVETARYQLAKEAVVKVRSL